MEVTTTTPAVALLLGGLLVAIAPSRVLRKVIMVTAPVCALVMVLMSDLGVHGEITIADFNFVTYRLDPLSRIFGVIFLIAAFLNSIYGLHDRDRTQDASALIYAGAAVGAVFAGDLLTLFVFWELTALSSVALVWSRGGPANMNAGLRYLAIQVLSGVLLLAGAVVWGRDQGGSFSFGETLSVVGQFVDHGGELGLAPGGLLILLGFGIKAAFPFLHNWLQDSYPRATPVGAVVLSAFTTKLAIYALARGFAGYEPLIYIGAAMTAFPVFFAVIENDLRRVLAYSLNNQLGFMVCGIGIGTELALNGAAAHAFCHILYKALLFMSMGAVLLRTNTVKASELGGLYKTMPITAIFCMIGAASISAFPLFSGFVSKGMILVAALEEHHVFVWGVLLFASAGVLEHSGIKIPYFTFFGHDSKRRPKEAPLNMLVAMGIASFLCIYLALPFPNPDQLGGISIGMHVLYGMLPFAVDYEAYTWSHVLTQMQLLVAAAFAFALLMRLRLYPPERPSTILDFDWFYRRVGYDFVRWGHAVASRMWAHGVAAIRTFGSAWSVQMGRIFAPSGALNRTVTRSDLAVWTAILLGTALVLAYFA